MKYLRTNKKIQRSDEKVKPYHIKNTFHSLSKKRISRLVLQKFSICFSFVGLRFKMFAPSNEKETPPPLLLTAWIDFLASSIDII